MNKQAKILPNSVQAQVTELESLRTRISILKEQEENLKKMIYESYKSKLETAYKEKDEPFGVVNFKEEDFKISFTVPKKVKYDQEGLKKLYAEGAPVEVEFSVKETVFKSQDDAGKEAFMKYRTVEPGTLSIKVEYDT